MASVFDVAACILRKKGTMTAMKLQKLCFYSQAWSLVWDEKPLFNEPIQAWANGPVVPQLYNWHKGKFQVSKADFPNGDPAALTHEERDTVNAVLHYYGEKSSQWLSELTHREKPWKEARWNLAPGDRGSEEITQAAMAEYYGSL